MATETTANFDSQIHDGYSIGALRVAFTNVANPDNWKLPIDAPVDAASIAILRVAIPFFTGSVAKFTKREPNGPLGPVRLFVKADGYYKAVGA